MEPQAIIEKVRAMIGQDIGVSDWFLIDQKRIDEFCECTEDRQWIHTDPQRAADGPFGKTIAPGFLAVSLISAMSQPNKLASAVEQQDVVFLNYGMNKVRFLAPISVDSRLRSRMVLLDVKEKAEDRLLVTVQHTMEIEGQDQPVCVVEWVVYCVI